MSEKEKDNSFIKLPVGTCLLNCEEQSLKVELTASTAEDMATMQRVVADHLVRMAPKEELVIN